MRFPTIKSLATFLLVHSLFGGELAQAVDQSEIKIEGRWSVVGVIAGEPSATGKVTGIAVLRSNLSNKTYTLSVGDSVPNEFGFILQSVQAHSVQIASAGGNAVTLHFADTLPEPTTEVSSDAPDRARRFLDSYYRGFNHNRGDQGRGVAFDDEDDGDAMYMSPPAVTGAPRLSTSHDEVIRSTEVYRPRTYKMDEDGDGFTVNFDDDAAP